MKQWIAVCAVLMSVTVGARVLAHGGHDHKIMGTVTMAAPEHVMLKDTTGKDVTVKVTKDTKVKATPAMKVQDIKSGTRVVITAQEGTDKSMTAQLIEVGASSTDTSAGHDGHTQRK